MQRLSRTTEGTIGFFWHFAKPADINTEPLRGYVQLHEDKWIVLDCLDETPMNSFFAASEDNRKDWSESVVGITGEAGVLLLNQRFSGSQVRGGASRASTRHYRFRTLLAGVAVDALRTPRVRGVRAGFADGLAWAGMQVINEQPEYYQDGSHRLAKMTMVLDGSGQEIAITPGAGVKLSLRPTWAVSGPDESRSVLTSLMVECTSVRPAKFDELAQYVDSVRTLLWLCHGRIVECDSLHALPHYPPSASQSWADMWDDRLTERSPEVLPPRSSKKSRFALVGLQDLGAPSAISRWIKLYERHGRFVGPVLHGFRLDGRVPIQTRAMSIAAAIEYFVAFNRSQKKAWAADAHKNRALAKHAGRAFGRWIGDLERWADELQDVYNAIKHDPSKSVDPYRTLLLTEAGEVLIACIALDEIAGTRRPSVRFLGDHRTQELGRLLRKEFSSVA